MNVLTSENIKAVFNVDAIVKKSLVTNSLLRHSTVSPEAFDATKLRNPRYRWSRYGNSCDEGVGG